MNNWKNNDVVVKIGSSSLTNKKGEIDEEKFGDHIQAIAKLKTAGHEVIVVSSGAVAAGFRKLGYSLKTSHFKRKASCSGCWSKFINPILYRKIRVFDITTAQILLTRTDFSIKDRYKNA